MKTILLLYLLLVVPCFLAQSVALTSSTGVVPMATEGIRNQQFYQYRKEMDCGMPELYIFLDSSHNNYTIQSVDCQITSI